MQGELHIGAKWYLTLANSDVPQVDSSHRKCCHYVISIRQKGVRTDFQASPPPPPSVYIGAFHPRCRLHEIFTLFLSPPPPPRYIFNNPRYGMKMNLIRSVHRSD